MVNALPVAALPAAAVNAASALAGGTPPSAALSGAAAAPPGFLDTLNQALHSVSAAQGEAAVAEAGFSAGVPGATLAKALVASDRATVAWNATVAVRNELVSAYQSVMNMQF